MEEDDGLQQVGFFHNSAVTDERGAGPCSIPVCQYVLGYSNSSQATHETGRRSFQLLVFNTLWFLVMWRTQGLSVVVRLSVRVLHPFGQQYNDVDI